MYPGYNLMITKEDMAFIVNIGSKAPGDKKQLNAFVNRLLESLYSRSYLGTHSLTGGECAVLKKHKGKDADLLQKEGFPKSEITAIICNMKFFLIRIFRKCFKLFLYLVFVTACWKKWHKKALDEMDIRAAIRAKLSTEDRSYKSKMTPANSSEEAASASGDKRQGKKKNKSRNADGEFNETEDDNA